MNLSHLTFLAIPIVVSACSNQQLYNAAQHNVQTECAKLLPPQDEACMDAASESYQSYERQRQEVLDAE